MEEGREREGEGKREGERGGHECCHYSHLPCQVCDAGVVDVGDEAEWNSMLSVVQQHRVRTGYSIHHPVLQTAQEDKSVQ